MVSLGSTDAPRVLGEYTGCIGEHDAVDRVNAPYAFSEDVA
jgi:hypothetical protein